MKQIELCDSIIISAKTVIADAEELKAKENKIRKDEKIKTLNELIDISHHCFDISELRSVMIDMRNSIN